MSKIQVKKMVLSCLERYPETRNSDITLTQTLWSYYYPSKVHSSASGNFIYLRDLFDLPREDHIKRIRANIQNDEHLFLPTSYEVMKKRKDAKTSWREYLGYEMTKEQWEQYYRTNAELESQLNAALKAEGSIIDPEPEQGELL